MGSKERDPVPALTPMKETGYRVEKKVREMEIEL